MTLMQSIAQKLGKFIQRKSGEEFIFSCPKCHHAKLEINPRKKLFHCFRCGHKGTLAKILKDLNVRPFSAIAVQDIAKPVEIEAQEYKIPWYHPVITVEAESYLRTRQVGDGFRGGYSTDRNLQRRLVIPIIERGITVSYIARAIHGQEPKELSGPNRSWFLYNIDCVKKDEPVVIVEGIFDAEAVARAGFNAVAIMGSNISDTQIGKLLAKAPDPIIIMLDGDQAGAEGAVKTWRKLLKRTHTPIIIVNMDDGVDPDEVPTEQLEKLLRDAWQGNQ